MKRRQVIQGGGLALGGLLLPWPTIPASTVDIESRESRFNKRRLAETALLNAKQLKATYCDIRLGQYFTQSILTENAEVESITNTQSLGFGVRVLVNGAWGFYASNNLTDIGVAEATQKAVAIAKANQFVQVKPLTWIERKGVGDQVWQTPIKVDPFSVSLREKLDLLKQAGRRALRAGATQINANLHLVNEKKYFASSEGSFIDQDIYRIWAPFELAVQDSKTGKVATRHGLSAPMGMGFEYLQAREQDKKTHIITHYDRSYDLVADAVAAAKQAKEKLKSPTVKPGQYELLIDPSLMYLLIHETIGHTLEMDRILGHEVNTGDNSFVNLSEWQAKQLFIGNPALNLFADRSQPGALGSVKYDDEGMRTSVSPLIKKGEIVGFPATREYWGLTGREYMGCSFADSWANPQTLRMPNVSLAPNAESLSLDAMIKTVDTGLYMTGSANFSIDRNRDNFQFGSQLCYEIKEGEVVGQVQQAVCQTDTRRFWQNYIHSCDKSDYRLGGSFYDGKGQPMQLSAVSHGSATSRFSDMSVTQASITGA